MKRIRLVLGILAMTIALPAGGHARAIVRIVALGDSTTAGTPLFKSPVEAPPNGSGDERSQYAYWIV